MILKFYHLKSFFLRPICDLELIWQFVKFFKTLGFPGGARRNRTADLLNAIQTLYQLSYDPMPEQKTIKLKFLDVNIEK